MHVVGGRDDDEMTGLIVRVPPSTTTASNESSSHELLRPDDQTTTMLDPKSITGRSPGYAAPSQTASHCAGLTATDAVRPVASTPSIVPTSRHPTRGGVVGSVDGVVGTVGVVAGAVAGAVVDGDARPVGDPPHAATAARAITTTALRPRMARA